MSIRPTYQLLGLGEQEAKDIISSWGCTSRTTSVDGVPRMITADMHADRYNLKLQDGKVAYVGIG